jgi:hypothetical protein
MADLRIEWPASRTAELVAYTERIQAEAIAAAGKAVAFIHERVVQKARLDPDWSTLADNIEVWSADGQLVIGVKDNDLRSQAFLLEYGDEVRPPSPLFRTLAEDMRDAGNVMADHMSSKFGPGGVSSAANSASSTT